MFDEDGNQVKLTSLNRYNYFLFVNQFLTKNGIFRFKCRTLHTIKYKKGCPKKDILF